MKILVANLGSTSFKYKLFFSEIPHNYSFGARTFFAGVGTADLDYAAVNRAKDTDTRLTSWRGASSAARDADSSLTRGRGASSRWARASGSEARR